ncbi:MAG: hypothetical protein ACE37K_04430 [Planctomycetota bacterium]|jgi:hypothetical protein
MQRLLLSAAAIGVLAASSEAQCFEQNFGVLAPLAGGTAGFGDDVHFDVQPLNFAFPMGTATYTHAQATDNGIIYLTNGGASNGPMGAGNGYQPVDVFLGTTVGDDPRIAPLFMDLWSQAGVSGGVWINNTIPGKFVVTWERVVEWWATTQPGPDPQYTFQAQIFQNGDVHFYFDGNVMGTLNPAQDDPRCGVSRGDGVVDPGASDLTTAPQNLTDFVMYEPFPAYTLPNPSPFDLNDTVVQFLNTGSGYLCITQACNPAFHEPYGQGCYSISDSGYEELTPAGMDLSGMMISGLSLGSAPGTGYLLTTTTGAGGITPGPTAVSLPLGDDDQVDTATVGGTMGLSVGSNGWVSVGTGNTNGFTPSVVDFLNQPSEWFTAWTDLQPNATGSGLVWYEENGSVATITYDGVYGWNTTLTNTFQFTYDSSNANFTLEFGALSTANPENWVVGYSPAGPSVDGGGVDLSTLNGAVLSAQNVAAMTLGASGAPISSSTAGSTVTYTADNMFEIAPGVTLGLVALSTIQSDPGVPLAFLGAPGCDAFVGSLDVTLTLLGAGPTQSTTFNLPPGVPSGFELYAQAVNLVTPNSLPNGQNAFGMILSNGVRSYVSSF